LHGSPIADIRHGKLNAYRCTLTIPACVTICATGFVEPSVNGSNSPSARAANFSAMPPPDPHRYVNRFLGIGSDETNSFVPKAILGSREDGRKRTYSGLRSSLIGCATS